MPSFKYRDEGVEVLTILGTIATKEDLPKDVPEGSFVFVEETGDEYILLHGRWKKYNGATSIEWGEE